MTQYADRIAAVHLKDVHLDQAEAARDADADYFEATVTKFTVWTEPGRGDVDLLAAVRALPDAFRGWLVVEVDVPEADSNLASTELSAQWITDHLRTDAF
jgi:inosose dehydratase